MVATIVVTADADHVMVVALAVLHAEIHRAVAMIDQVSRLEAGPRIDGVHLPTAHVVTMIVVLPVAKMVSAEHFPIETVVQVATIGARVAMMIGEDVPLKVARLVTVVAMMTGEVALPNVVRLAIVIAALAAMTGVRVAMTVSGEALIVRVVMMTGQVARPNAEHFQIVIAAPAATTGAHVAMMIVVRHDVKMANVAALERIVVVMIVVRVGMMTEAAEHFLIAIAAQVATISGVPSAIALVVMVGPSVVRRSGNVRLVMSGTSARSVQTVVLTTNFCPRFRRTSTSRCCRDRFSQNSRRCHRDSAASSWTTSHVR